jgi:hypothetical protein
LQGVLNVIFMKDASVIALHIKGADVVILSMPLLSSQFRNKQTLAPPSSVYLVSLLLAHYHYLIVNHHSVSSASSLTLELRNPLNLPVQLRVKEVVVLINLAERMLIKHGVRCWSLAWVDGEAIPHESHSLGANH